MQVVPELPERGSGHDITIILKSSFSRNKLSYTPSKGLFLLLTYIVTENSRTLQSKYSNNNGNSARRSKRID